MKILNKMEQYSDEWWEARAGRLTASNAQAIQACGKGLETYVYKILAEKYSKNHESYTNEAMQRGTELEPLARMTYEIETNNKVKEVGMIIVGDHVSASPDGLIGKDGGLEIKCLNKEKHFKILLNGIKEVDAQYIWQVHMSLLVSGRKWWDLAFYHPDFDQSLIIFRIKPDDIKREKLIVGIEEGKVLIKELENKFKMKNEKN